ncbi:MAG: hypothetical protein ACOY4R_00130 [Pseudomonadota bacterium]
MKHLIPPLLIAALLSLAAPSLAQTDKPAERTALPSKGLLWGSKMTLESEACCTALPGAKLPDRTEAAVLAKLADRAQRDGPILKLRLQGGRTLKITDCDVEDACEAERFRTHRLAAWWPASGYYVVKVNLYQGGFAYLVSERTGRTTRVVAVPVPSPSGSRAVAMGEDELEIIDLSGESPSIVTVTEGPRCGGASEASLGKPVWIDDSRIRFEGLKRATLHVGAGKADWQC